ncbi:unnamed protein product [Ranitomeya imitator]|uniref:Recombination activating protein 1 n=1 Tax=Ranitomeya imitator TaxID=111125 RepID=A0ABN9LBF1_9NEOB|nr:unnamed protein product [Ranitomeya imitator]
MKTFSDRTEASLLVTEGEKKKKVSENLQKQIHEWKHVTKRSKKTMEKSPTTQLKNHIKSLVEDKMAHPLKVSIPASKKEKGHTASSDSKKYSQEATRWWWWELTTERQRSSHLQTDITAREVCCLPGGGIKIMIDSFCTGKPNNLSRSVKPPPSRRTRIPGHLGVRARAGGEDLLKKCHQCMETIVKAKDQQAAEANKNASILLKELDLEKSREESRKQALAAKREKRKEKRKKKKEEQKKKLEDDDCKLSETCELGAEDAPSGEVLSLHLHLLVLPLPMFDPATTTVANYACAHCKKKWASGQPSPFCPSCIPSIMSVPQEAPRSRDECNPPPPEWAVAMSQSVSDLTKVSQSLVQALERIPLLSNATSATNASHGDSLAPVQDPHRGRLEKRDKKDPI